MAATDYSILREVGLSGCAILCYESLYKEGPAKAGWLAKRLRKSRAGIYEALKWLEEWGFVERLIPILPEAARFRAVRLDKALENLAIRQRRLVRDIVEEQIELSISRHGQYSKTAGRDWR